MVGEQGTSLLRRRSAALIVAVALFMANLDSSVLSTSLPPIAADLGVNPIDLKLALTSYMLALAIFIPASGWIADRLGARLVFRAAMLVFAGGSVACAFATDLFSLVGGRVVQGIGGAMMVPVGRLVVLRVTPRTEIVSAMAWLTMPALLAPVMGPPLGGFLATYFDWRLIFWINIPFAALGVVLATAYIPDVRGGPPGRFDGIGFLLLGPGLAAFLTGATVAGLDMISPGGIAALMAGGLVLLVLYTLRALRIEAPLIDLRLLRIQTFRASLVGGFLFRVSVGATPFLLPLMFQIGFGLTAFQSGMLTFASGIGALTMKTLAAPILNRVGFRRVLGGSAVIAALLLGLPGLFGVDTPWILITVTLLFSGFMRSLFFTSLNALSYADTPPEALSRASTFVAVLQELSGSVGVALAALGLEAAQAAMGGPVLDLSHFPPLFAGVTILGLATAVIFFRLPADAGDQLLTRRGARPAETPAE